MQLTANRMRRAAGLGVGAAALAGLGVLAPAGHAAWASCHVPANNALLATNGYYCVYVLGPGSTYDGVYTIATGPNHPVPGENLLYGGTGGSPGTSFNSVKSYTSSTVYSQGGEGGGTSLTSASPVTTAVGGTGIQTVYTVTTPDQMKITQLIQVNGTSFDTSNVQITTTLQDTSATTPLLLGLRYLLDWQIGPDDGPSLTPHNPDGATRNDETTDAPPAYEYYSVTNNGTPLYTIDGSGTGPTNLAVTPTTPTRLDFVEWGSASSSSFDYAVNTSRSTSDSAELYYWGDAAQNALALTPGGSATETVLLFATTANAPPPFSPSPMVSPSPTPTASSTATPRPSAGAGATVSTPSTGAGTFGSSLGWIALMIGGGGLAIALSGSRRKRRR